MPHFLLDLLCFCGNVNFKMELQVSKIDALMENLEKSVRKIAVIHVEEDARPNTVAFVLVEKNMTDTEKLETAFKLTNSIDTAWWLNENVEPLTKGTRSTSVGDMVLSEQLNINVNQWDGPKYEI